MKLITYDISKNNTRRKLSDALKAYGCIRVQKSVFLGDMKRRYLDDIINKFLPVFDKDDKLYFITVAIDDIEDMLAIGEVPDITSLLDDSHTIFL